MTQKIWRIKNIALYLRQNDTFNNSNGPRRPIGDRGANGKRSKKMENTSSKTKVYNVIIMDRSGSMWDIQRPAIQGFNEVLGGVKASAQKYADTQEQYISLVLFDSSAVEFVHWNADPESVPILTSETYVPGAATPLYDAMGKTLTRLEKELKGDENHSVVVTVITDGYENDSHEYNLAAIRALVEHLKDEGWSFAYMGTDHDVHGVSVSLSITNVIKFEKTEEETLETFRKERRARERWAAEENDFNLACPNATYEERVRSKKARAMHFYADPIPGYGTYYGRIATDLIKRLDRNEVFVFGSNDRGLHNGGAALKAVRSFGAQMGVAEGPQGQSYAIPTVGANIGPEEIRAAFRRFVDYAKAHPEKVFLVTALGCGHGGYTADTMAPLLADGVPVENIHYPYDFWKVYERMGLV